MKIQLTRVFQSLITKISKIASKDCLHVMQSNHSCIQEHTAKTAAKQKIE
jgi:hypothetical protein